MAFDDPDYDGTVAESAAVRFEGHEYELHSTKWDDRKIGISHADFYKSLTSTNNANTHQGKRYGWLRVSGNSMNAANPVPIENGDYVLFYENRTPRDEQVEIACLLGPDVQNLPLVVKRIRMRSGKLILRSESCDKDTKYPDIAISREQLLGEVIAVAKPKGVRSEGRE